MNLRNKLTTFALTITAVLSMLLTGCGEQPVATTGTDTTAQQDFLKERQGTPDPNFTPVVGTGGPGSMQFFAGPGQGGAFGSVEKVEGRNITLKNPMDGSTQTVHLADDAKIATQADAQLSELKVGDNITAVGKLEGDTLTAMSVQVGGDTTGQMSFSGPGGTGSTGGPGGKVGPGNNVITFDNGTPQTPGTMIVDGTPVPMLDGTIAEMAQVVVGTIETIDGQAITIKSADGKSTVVKVNADTQLNKEAELDIAKVETGMMMSATGELKGDVFEASAARILPAMQMMKP